ncbi:toprim domain-containing protein [Spirosoma harenae]
MHPLRVVNGQLLYYSPLTIEKTPSFYLHLQKNVFNCFSSGEKGDIIRLVTLIEKLTFKAALERLAAFDPIQYIPFSFGGLNDTVEPPSTPEPSKLILLDDRALFSQILMDYVKERGIPPKLAIRYLHAVQYLNGKRQYEAIGFKTDKDSDALRSKYFKGWLGPCAIRTIPVDGSTEVNVFEGFFDFLSALTFYRLFRPKQTTIILNSTSNLQQALPVMEGAKRVNCFFDNDDAGRRAIAKLRALSIPVRDCSSIYAKYNDFNDMVKHNANIYIHS